LLFLSNKNSFAEKTIFENEKCSREVKSKIILNVFKPTLAMYYVYFLSEIFEVADLGNFQSF